MRIDYHEVKKKEQDLIDKRELKKKQQLDITKSCQSCAKVIKSLEDSILANTNLTVYDKCIIILNKGEKGLEDKNKEITDAKSQILRYEGDLERYAEDARNVKEEIANLELAINYANVQVDIKNHMSSTDAFDPHYLIFDIDVYTYNPDTTWQSQKLNILYRSIQRLNEVNRINKWVIVDPYGNENEILDAKTSFIVSYYLTKHLKQ